MESQMTVGQIMKNSILKLFFELIGTAFLTITFNATLFKEGTFGTLEPSLSNFPQN